MTRILIASLPAWAVILAAFFLLTTPVLAACGVASWYSTENNQTVTANGEKYTGNDMTAAHKTLRFGTKLRVTYRGNAVTVRVNDRGPYIKGRSLDLSRAAAKKLGLIPAGVDRVCWERLP